MLFRLILTIMLTSFLTAANAQADPVPYALFDSKGKRAKYKKLAKAAKAADIILFGESHNSAIAHWLQNVVARDLRAAGPLSIGMEMFESDQQIALDRYLAGEIKAEALDSVGEGLWNNFKTDYQPLVDWAGENDVPVIASNVPRRYARVVFKDGFTGLEALSAEEKKLLPTLPVPYDATLPGYVKMLEMMPGGHGGETFPMAQAIKDATMAHFIVARKQAGRRFLHLNGSYHSDNYEGIGWYLKQYAPELKVMTISTVEQEMIRSLEAEYLGKADFIIAVPEMMTRTY
ncbi:ChaN family lipoprotein [Neolewinella persica]|uniref:ChaN family lipoprotein n=1 Tax=Neolewinella persica TaxID=70998 RepID=UPI0003649B18|nr:ChaN family lipoprotein [Neolewinella persica]